MLNLLNSSWTPWMVCGIFLAGAIALAAWLLWMAFYATLPGERER